ncbi:PKD domain-containing protein [Sphingobacterium pedocola]|uniref:PKD domain-containing protein n=1 Tax=Sphingobacterium pedocola TaxID=2082722 RepID=A0ABR9T1Q1_9SPHI|nr:PKD domain-containing protein [Sphingobacterium pedocola]MBE8719248.1 hypothetical protein [Sphingobacterium pedocola]
MKILKRIVPAFLITLIVFAGCKNEKYDFDSLPPTVKSFFTITNTELHIDEEIHFKNESADGDSYSWDFGDGTTSTEKEPTKTYTAPGAYTIKLKVVGPGGTGNYAKDIAVIDPNAVIETDKELYFIEYGNPVRAIRKISLEIGATVETVVSLTSRAGYGLAYDAINKKFYFSDYLTTANGMIWSFNSDASNVQSIVSGITDPYAVAVNPVAGKIYWADDAGNISRANLDGGDFEKEFIHVQLTATRAGQMRAVAYNSKTDLIYFYEVYNEDLYVAKSDGTSVEKIVSDVYGYGMFVDEVNSKIYFEDRNSSSIIKANLDGSNQEKFVDLAASSRAYGMAIDYTTNKFYWTQLTSSSDNSGLIKRADLDGNNAETFLSGIVAPGAIIIKDKED